MPVQKKSGNLLNAPRIIAYIFQKNFIFYTFLVLSDKIVSNSDINCGMFIF